MEKKTNINCASQNKYFDVIFNTLRQILYCIKWAPTILYNIRKVQRNEVIMAELFLSFKGKKMIHNNWGDDLNIYLFKLITKQDVVSIPFSVLPKRLRVPHYLLIGSIIGFYDLDNTIIYGSGLKDPSATIKGKPKVVHSVRGPKTRNILLQHGIECPEKYGDPALLLPYFYMPQKKPSGKICVIANMGTDKKDIRNLTDLLDHEKFELVDMCKYDKWTDIIDRIVNSSGVISESLHGLIVAETYGVPSVWVEFIEHPDYWSFKYCDFYESIQKKEESSIKVYQNNDVNQIFDKMKNWEQGKIDVEKMILDFPFKMSNIIKS